MSYHSTRSLIARKVSKNRDSIKSDEFYTIVYCSKIQNSSLTKVSSTRILQTIKFLTPHITKATVTMPGDVVVQCINGKWYGDQVWLDQIAKF